MNTDNEKRPRQDAEGGEYIDNALVPGLHCKDSKSSGNEQVLEALFDCDAVKIIANKVKIGNDSVATVLGAISEDECKEILASEDYQNAKYFVPSAAPSAFERVLQCTIRRIPMVPKRFLGEWQDDRNKYISIFPEFGFTTVAGQAKAGKTTALTYVMAAFILGQYGGLRFQTNEKDVLTYVDTEQDPTDTYGIVRANLISIVARAKGCTSEQAEVIVMRRVHLLNVKILEKSVMKETISAAVTTIKPRLLIIDGPRDMVQDINNQSEATELNDFFKTIQSQATLVVVIHQNFGSEKVRGAIGSESYNKGDVIEVSKDSDGVMSMKYLISRNRTPEHPIAFKRNENGIPIPIGYVDPYVKIKEAMEQNKAYTRPELLEVIKRETGLKERSADGYLKRLQRDSDIDFNDRRPNTYTKINTVGFSFDDGLPF